MHSDAQGRDIHFGLKLVTPPAAAKAPLSLAEAKSYLRAGDTEDALIAQLVTAARAKVEKDTRRALINQIFELTLDGVPSRGVIALPIAPVSAVSIKSYATDNVESVVDPATYRLDTHSLPNRIVLNDSQVWPSSLRERAALVVSMTCGYGAEYSDVIDVPLLQAIRLLLDHWYSNRSAVEIGTITATVPFAYDFLIEPMVVPYG